jgi:hypothetical protein
MVWRAVRYQPRIEDLAVLWWLIGWDELGSRESSPAGAESGSATGHPGLVALQSPEMEGRDGEGGERGLPGADAAADAGADGAVPGAAAGGGGRGRDYGE